MRYDQLQAKRGACTCWSIYSGTRWGHRGKARPKCSGRRCICTTENYVNKSNIEQTPKASGRAGAKPGCHGVPRRCGRGGTHGHDGHATTREVVEGKLACQAKPSKRAVQARGERNAESTGPKHGGVTYENKGTQRRRSTLKTMRSVGMQAGNAGV